MKPEFKWAFYGLGIFIVIILGILAGPKYTAPIPAPFPFGFAFIAIIFMLDLGIENWRGKTTRVICNVGQWSINTSKDMFRIPWQTDIITEEDKKNANLGSLSVMFLGGIDYWGLSMKGGPEYPVLIFPSKYENKEEQNFHVFANLKRREFSELSPYLRHVLKYYPRRVTKTTPIYYGATSHLDGSDTMHNLKIEFQEKTENKQITSLENKLEAMYLQFRKADEQKSNKSIFVGKELKAVEEGT